MLLEPPFDAPVASAMAPEPAFEQQLEIFHRHDRLVPTQCLQSYLSYCAISVNNHIK